MKNMATGIRDQAREEASSHTVIERRILTESLSNERELVASREWVSCA